MLIGKLGEQEILLCACDDGDVVAYYTSAIAATINAVSDYGYEESKATDSFLKPMLLRNLGKSAWGLAVHTQGRLIAASCNSHNITVFSFALKLPEFGLEEYGNDRLQEIILRRERDTEYRLTGHRFNIPNISFLNSDSDLEGRYLVSTDLTGVILLWDLHQRKTIEKINSRSSPDFLSQRMGWSVVCVVPASARCANSSEELLGCEAHRNFRRFLDISASRLLLRDSALHPPARHEGTARNRANANRQTQDASYAADAPEDVIAEESEGDAQDQEDEEEEDDESARRSQAAVRDSIREFAAAFNVTADAQHPPIDVDEVLRMSESDLYLEDTDDEVDYEDELDDDGFDIPDESNRVYISRPGPSGYHQVEQVPQEIATARQMVNAMSRAQPRVQPRPPIHPPTSVPTIDDWLLGVVNAPRPQTQTWQRLPPPTHALFPMHSEINRLHEFVPYTMPRDIMDRPANDVLGMPDDVNRIPNAPHASSLAIPEIQERPTTEAQNESPRQVSNSAQNHNIDFLELSTLFPPESSTLFFDDIDTSTFDPTAFHGPPRNRNSVGPMGHRSTYNGNIATNRLEILRTPRQSEPMFLGGNENTSMRENIRQYTNSADSPPRVKVRPPLPTPAELPFAIFHTGMDFADLYRPPFSHPSIITCNDPCHQHVTPTFDHLSDLDRLNMTHYIPELSIVITASPIGRAAIFTITRGITPAAPPSGSHRLRPGLELKSRDEGQDRVAMRLDWVIPFASQEARGERPAKPLVGIATAPLQGLDEPPEFDYDGKKLPGRVNRRGKDRWRLFLTYEDQTVLSYELWRESDGSVSATYPGNGKGKWLGGLEDHLYF